MECGWANKILTLRCYVESGRWNEVEKIVVDKLLS